MDIANVSVDDAGAETMTNVLLNEILLHIFRFLRYEDLIIAERVCCRWKTVVETCFATEKRLKFAFLPLKDLNALDRLRRYGNSIRTLNWHVYIFYDRRINWVEEIADRFPNLSTMELRSIKITNEDFKYLSTKCCHLTNVTLNNCSFTDEGLKVFLQALPAIKSLGIYNFEDRFVTPSCGQFTPRLNRLYQQTDVSTVFSNCRNLHTLVLLGHIRCNDEVSFFKFCKECATLRMLAIHHSDLPNEMIVQIQHCSLLEELRLHNCPNVGNSTLSVISLGCPNLRTVSLMHLQLVGDEGLKCFARCKQLSCFKTDIRQMTDETLVVLSKCVNLREMKVAYCKLVSDRGCVTLLAHCPQLELLDVKYCKEVSNVTVDSAIEAVECRQNGLVLQLMLRSTSVTPESYENCHPLLYSDYRSFQAPFISSVTFYKPSS